MTSNFTIRILAKNFEPRRAFKGLPEKIETKVEIKTMKLDKRRKINFFIIGYTSAFIVLALIGYKMVDKGGASAAYHRIIEHSYFTTDLAIYDLPRINVNLIGGDGKTARVRIDLSLEVAKQDMERLEGFKPRITDKVIDYMRGQNLSELSPPEAMRELHEDLLRVVDSASRPIPVHEVIFRQFLVM